MIGSVQNMYRKGAASPYSLIKYSKLSLNVYIYVCACVHIYVCICVCVHVYDHNTIVDMTLILVSCLSMVFWSVRVMNLSNFFCLLWRRFCNKSQITFLQISLEFWSKCRFYWEHVGAQNRRQRPNRYPIYGVCFRISRKPKDMMEYNSVNIT